MVKYNNNRYWSDYFDRINRIIFEFSRQFHNKLAKSFEHRYPLTTKKRKNTKRFNVPSNSFSLSSWQSISAISCLRFVYDGKDDIHFPSFFISRIQCNVRALYSKINEISNYNSSKSPKSAPSCIEFYLFFTSIYQYFPPRGKYERRPGNKDPSKQSSLRGIDIPKSFSYTNYSRTKAETRRKK